MKNSKIVCGVKCWGGCFDTCNTLKDNGITDGCYYFSRESEKEKFLKFLNNYSNNGLMVSDIDKRLLDKGEWKASYKLIFNGMHLPVFSILPSFMSINDVKYYLLEGNYSCDCARAEKLQEFYPHMKGLLDDIPCGFEIGLEDLKIEGIKLNDKDIPVSNGYICIETLYTTTNIENLEKIFSSKDLCKIISKGNVIKYDEHLGTFITNKGLDVGNLSNEILEKYFVEIV